jgi:thiol-disulfide isomerase/thioredoxin
MNMWTKMIGAFGCAAILLAVPAHAGGAIQPFDADGMTRIAASQNGKPFVLVVWSLECEYCQASLSALAREKRKHKNFNVVTLATDAAGDPQAAALMQKKLATSGMAGNAWAFGDAPPEQLRYAIDPKWHGEMPRSYWFNARGERIAYSGTITPDVIARLGADRH